jgi:hypothetical protein
VHHPNAILNNQTAQCCLSINADGSCVGPQSGNAPPDPPYGYPRDHPALVVEGAVGYKNSFPVWNGTTGLGAFGFTAITPESATDTGCPPLGNDAWSRRLQRAGLVPISLNAHGEPSLHSCLLGCNWTHVQQTGVDPCSAGSHPVTQPHAVYSCFYGGPGWITPASMGVCGFNCSARTSSGVPCTQQLFDEHECFVDCGNGSL